MKTLVRKTAPRQLRKNCLIQDQQVKKDVPTGRNLHARQVESEPDAPQLATKLDSLALQTILEEAKKQPTHIYFFPETFRLSYDLERLREQLASIRIEPSRQAILHTNSSLILVAIPLLLALRPSLSVRLQLRERDIHSGRDGEPRKRIHDLIHTAKILRANDITTVFIEDF